MSFLTQIINLINQYVICNISRDSTYNQLRILKAPITSCATSRFFSHWWNRVQCIPYVDQSIEYKSMVIAVIIKRIRW